LRAGTTPIRTLIRIDSSTATRARGDRPRNGYIDLVAGANQSEGADLGEMGSVAALLPVGRPALDPGDGCLEPVALLVERDDHHGAVDGGIERAGASAVESPDPLAASADAAQVEGTSHVIEIAFIPGAPAFQARDLRFDVGELFAKAGEIVHHRSSCPAMWVPSSP